MRQILALVCLTALGAAQDNPTFRAAVSLVHVDAEAVTEDGRIIDGLHKEDFRVFDERKQQSIVQFGWEDEPLDLILLFDVSGSMQAVVQDVADAAREGFHELQHGDRICVMVFNTKAREIAPFTEDLDAVDRTIHDDVLTRTFGGGTWIQAAVSAAALRFRREPHGQRRRAVLIITDNIGMRTRREQSVVEEFWESDAILSGLIVRNPRFEALRTASVILGPQNLALQAGMKGIAQKTGGDAITANEPGTAFRDAMRRIRTRYSLYYALPAGKPGTLRTIRVELSPEAAKRFPKARVRARTGYVMPKEEAASSR
ncbi:MAG TPA: VWA domain-containing protein [Bryobacteraceae bacterium]|nr:VWA domain-containing protein [Bryobacteraceae bacterium]